MTKKQIIEILNNNFDHIMNTYPDQERANLRTEKIANEIMELFEKENVKPKKTIGKPRERKPVNKEK